MFSLLYIDVNKILKKNGMLSLLSMMLFIIR